MKINDLEKEQESREARITALKKDIIKADQKNKHLEKEILLQVGTICKKDQQLKDLSKDGAGFTETSEF